MNSGNLGKDDRAFKSKDSFPSAANPHSVTKGSDDARNMQPVQSGSREKFTRSQWRVRIAGENDVVDWENEMWDRFYESGFWRSDSRRKADNDE